MEDVLIILTKSPFGRIFSVEGIRIASGLGAMDFKTKFMLLGESILTLHKNQDGTGIKFPTLDKGVSILEMSDVEIIVVKEDMERFGMKESDLIGYPLLNVINKEEMARIIAEAACSFRF
ncbi:MAG: DsrE family protein [Promethearchaeota archaeon]